MFKQLLFMSNVEKYQEIIHENKKDPHARVYFMLIKTVSVIEMIIKETLKPYHLVHSQLNIMGILLSQHPKPMAAHEIKEKLLTASPDISRLIDKLCEKGLVQREFKPYNRRQLEISLTEEGMDFYIYLHDLAKIKMKNYFKNEITEDEAKVLFSLLKKLELF